MDNIKVALVSPITTAFLMCGKLFEFSYGILKEHQYQDITDESLGIFLSRPDVFTVEDLKKTKTEEKVVEKKEEPKEPEVKVEETKLEEKPTETEKETVVEEEKAEKEVIVEEKSAPKAKTKTK